MSVVMLFGRFLSTVVNQQLSHPTWRAGQVASNTLERFRPDIADRVRGNPTLDPYYKDENLNAFYEFVEKVW